jgi:hypothetical protein
VPNLQDPALLALAGTQPSHLWARPPRSKKRRPKKDKPELEASSAPPAPRVRCDTTFTPVIPAPAGWNPVQLQLAAGLRGFFEFYASFDFEHTALAIADGGAVPRQQRFVEPLPEEQQQKKTRRRRKGKEERKESGEKAPTDGNADAVGTPPAPRPIQSSAASEGPGLEAAAPAPAPNTSNTLPPVDLPDIAASTDQLAENGLGSEEQPSSEPVAPAGQDHQAFAPSTVPSSGDAPDVAARTDQLDEDEADALRDDATEADDGSEVPEPDDDAGDRHPEKWKESL